MTEQAVTVEIPTIWIGLLLVAVVVITWVLLARYVNRRWIDPWIEHKINREEEGP